MIEESKRRSYLQAMGVTEWVLANQDEVEVEAIDAPALEAEAQQPIVSSTVEPLRKVSGLRWLNQGSKNGLLVILSEHNKNLRPESRALMSKMLNGIHFLPSETGFATVCDTDHQTSGDLTVEAIKAIKAILVFGHEAGRLLVKISGARIIPGTEFFSLENRKMVISLHPDELLEHPEDKQRVWKDLKQLVEFFNGSD